MITIMTATVKAERAEYFTIISIQYVSVTHVHSAIKGDRRMFWSFGIKTSIHAHTITPTCIMFLYLDGNTVPMLHAHFPMQLLHADYKRFSTAHE